jgi:hypothetical protein
MIRQPRLWARWYSTALLALEHLRGGLCKGKREVGAAGGGNLVANLERWLLALPGYLP